MSKITVIVPADGKCQLCGVVEELRPYGPGGKFVCFDCMMLDEDGAKKQFGQLLDGGMVVIDARGKNVTSVIPQPDPTRRTNL